MIKAWLCWLPDLQPSSPQRPGPAEQESSPAVSPPDPAVSRYYAAVSQQKWRGIPEDMRGGLRMDRWGTLHEKNPAGRGWREKGSDDVYEIKPNSSW